MPSMSRYAKTARRPIGVAAIAVAVVVMAQLSTSPAQAAASSAAPLAASTGSVYVDTVLGDGAAHLWRLGEASGTVGADVVGAGDLALNASATRGVAGALTNEASKATTFPGTATVPATTTTAATGPQSFSAAAWFKTTSTTGGKIIGWGSSSTALSGSYDRHVYMTNAGNLIFGVWPNSVRAVASPRTYNDGQWHQVVATLGSSGMNLFVDGQRVAIDSSVTTTANYSGYWRIGGDNWPRPVLTMDRATRS